MSQFSQKYEANILNNEKIHNNQSVESVCKSIQIEFPLLKPCKVQIVYTTHEKDDK